MEKHPGKFSGRIPDSIEELFDEAMKYVQQFHQRTLDMYRGVSLHKLTPQKFWSEYIWCVYASGFNAKVLSQKIDALLTAIGPHNLTYGFGWVWPRVQSHIANRIKCEAVCECRELMRTLGWDQFRAAFCSELDSLQSLPFIGPITKHHLARNIGFDTVKEDLHLVRFAEHYQFPSATIMCEFLAELYQERIGVVDFCIWAYGAAVGTAELA